MVLKSGDPLRRLAKSFLVGLATEDPDADDARFVSQAGAIKTEDCFDIPGAGKRPEEDSDDDFVAKLLGEEPRKDMSESKSPVEALQDVGEKLAKDGRAMPGYGQIFIKKNGSGEAWYVGGDGDEPGFSKFVQEQIIALDCGIDEVRYESEVFPKEPGWIQVYPTVKDMSIRVAEDAPNEKAQAILASYPVVRGR